MDTILSEKSKRGYLEAIRFNWWEIREASFYLSGTTEFVMRYNIYEEYIRDFIGRESFGLWPLTASLFDDIPNQKSSEFILHQIHRYIDNYKIIPVAYNLLKISWIDKDHLPGNLTYFISSKEAVFVALIEGLILPVELQMALEISQCRKSSNGKKKGFINETKREALAHMLWFEEPELNISQITVKLFEIKMDSRERDKKFVGKFKDRHVIDTDSLGKYDWIHGESYHSPSNRNRLVKKVKNQGLNIIQRKGDKFAFDFQSLSIAANVYADYLCMTNPHILASEILEHPLFKPYIEFGGEFVAEFIEFSLKETLDDLREDHESQSF